MPGYAFPAPPPTIDPTPQAELDAKLDRLAANKASWAALPVAERLELLARLRDGVVAVADEWVAAALRAKGLQPDEPASGEEWLGGPMTTVRNIRLLENALREVEAHGAPKIARDRMTTRADGRLVVRVFPADIYEKLLFGGFSAEVWMQPGVTADNLAEHQASAYRNRDTNGKVALVLGAGNVASIPAMDALYKLFVENQVVLVKMNPVNEYLGPFLERAFRPLVERGWFEVCYGAGDVGKYLVSHAKVETIHITGSDQTHDAIVWGPPEGHAERKAKGERLNDKDITSELGNVTPIVIVPGPWSKADLRFQAENIATMVANNASFNCNAGKLLVMPRGWEHREALLAEIRAVLRSLPGRKAYYPGARDRWRRFVDAHRDRAEVLVPDTDEAVVPWTLITGLDPQHTDDICFKQEPFCAVLHEVSLPGDGAAGFIDQAVKFCNDVVWGSLAVMLLVHPDTRKDARAEAALQKALDDLRYGSIGVNHWAGVVYGLVSTSWGAYPGHTLEDIQSGRGVVHNTYLFDAPEKSVVYGPFRVFPKPPWFVTHRRTHRIGPKLTRFEAAPSLFKLPGIVLEAIQG